MLYCSALQHRQMDILKPLGLAPEDVKLPLSPRSEDAYARINEEFDMLYSQLQDPGEQAGQNHAEVCVLILLQGSCTKLLLRSAVSRLR